MTIKNYFGYGDRVIVNGYPGTIRSLWMDINREIIAHVVFDDPSLCPPTMDINQKYLIPEDSYDITFKKNRFYNKEVQCPRCGLYWTKTESPIHGKKQIWYDCLKCNVKKEDV